MDPVACQHCGRQLAVGEPAFLADNQTKVVCRPCRDIDKRVSIRRPLDFYGVRLTDYEARRTALTASLGRNPNHIEVIDAIYADLIKNAAPWPHRSSLYGGWAVEYHLAGLDPFPLKEQLQRLVLSLCPSFVKNALIVAQRDSCPACRALDGKILPVAEAQATMPIPCRECSFGITDTEPFAWCRCGYILTPKPRRLNRVAGL